MTSAREITAALGGRWHGRYGTSRCPAHDDRDPSLSVADGDDGRLLLRCFAGCDFESVLGALAAKGLATGGRPAAIDPEAVARREAERRADLEKRARQARAVWDEAEPIRGTLAERYLRHRGIDSLPPAALRFHPAAWHKDTARRFPAMVAAVTGGDGFAVHRTYLAPDGRTKAELEKPKMGLGPWSGGAVRLSAVTGPLLVAEGIETALSAGMLYNKPSRVWAALSTTGLTGLTLPRIPGELVIAADPGAPGEVAATKLAQRAHDAGWRVMLWRPPVGEGDWNDFLLSERRCAS